MNLSDVAKVEELSDEAMLMVMDFKVFFFLFKATATFKFEYSNGYRPFVSLFARTFSNKPFSFCFSFHRLVMKVGTTPDPTTITTPIQESSCSLVDTNEALPPMDCADRRETGLFLPSMCPRTREDPFLKCSSE